MTIYLDTHAVVWLHAGEPTRFTLPGQAAIEANDCLISPLVLLELQYLKEIKRIRFSPERIRHDLEREIGLRVCETDLIRVVTQSIRETWTRDPFDRMIVAQARVADAPLLSKDPHILKHYRLARW